MTDALRSRTFSLKCGERATVLAACLLTAQLLVTFFAWDQPIHATALVVLTALAALLALLDGRARAILVIGVAAFEAYDILVAGPVVVTGFQVVLLAALAGAALEYIRHRPPLKRRLSPWDLGALGLLLAAALSVPLSLDVPRSALGAIQIAAMVGMYFVLSRAALTEQGLRDITLTAIATSVVSAFVAIEQAYVPSSPLGPTFIMWDGTIRASAFFNHPNTLGVLLVLGSLLTLRRILTASGWRKRALWTAALAPQLIGLEATLSRADMLGLMAGAALLALLPAATARFRLAAVSVVLAAAIALSFALPAVSARMGTIASFTEDSSSMDRIYLSQVSLRMFSEHPLTGIGIGAFMHASEEHGYADPRVSIKPATDGHQMPFSIPAEMGLLGLAVEAVMVASLAVLVWRMRSTGRAKIYAGAVAAMAGFTVMSFFNTFLYNKPFWFGVALVGAAWQTVMAERKDDLLPAPEPGPASV